MILASSCYYSEYSPVLSVAIPSILEHTTGTKIAIYRKSQGKAQENRRKYIPTPAVSVYSMVFIVT
jgi:hypothetical protein